MIDTLRLTIPSSFFEDSVIGWLMGLQHKISKTDFTGQLVDWSLSTGVEIPSWFDGFSLSIGDRVTLEASPKVYQGHNVSGSDDLVVSARRLVDYVFGAIFNLSTWPDGALWYVARMDVTYNYDFPTFQALDIWLDTVLGVQRGQRRAGVEERADELETRPMSCDAMPSGRTVYIGKGSRYRVGKIYCKGRDLMAHPPKCLESFPEIVDELAQEFASLGRFELQIRALAFSRHAVKYGLLPAHFSDLLPGVFADNASKYLSDIGITPLHSKNKKQPIIYFPVHYLAKRLVFSDLWDAEFRHLFSTESAMSDDTLFTSLLSHASKPVQAQRAYDFYNRIRAMGFVQAKQSVSKSSFYRFRRLLNAAGVSDAMMQDGTALIRVPLDPVKVRLWNPNSDRLRLVEATHGAMQAGNIARLHEEVFRAA